MIDFKAVRYPKSVILYAVFFYVRYKEHAILAVRRARPGAIEKDPQDHYVLGYCRRGDKLAGKG